MVDTSSIVLSIKTNKKKSVTALLPFTKISDAFSAVMASGRKDKELDGVVISWAGGNEPNLVTWLKDHGQLGVPGAARSHPTEPRFPTISVSHENGQPAAPFSSFPEDLVGGIRISPRGTRDYADLVSHRQSPNSQSPAPRPPPSPGLDFESLTFMRMQQAERARLEREILEAEAQES